MNNTIRQYFQVVATCTATDPSDPKCECWHDIGTGPDPERTEKNSKGSWRDRPLEMDSETAQFHHHAARAFFASAWSDQREEAGKSTSGEIMDQMPPELDPEALNAASSLLAGMRLPIPEMLQYIREHADGDRQPTAEMFGHYAAMQAMGHGVGLNDAFGSETAEWIWGDNKIYMEFSGCDLSKDYFEDEGEIEPKEPEFRTLDEDEDIDIFAGLEETEFPQSGPPTRPCPELGILARPIGREVGTAMMKELLEEIRECDRERQAVDERREALVHRLHSLETRKAWKNWCG